MINIEAIAYDLIMAMACLKNLLVNQAKLVLVVEK
ncbi:hypothetical protein ICMP_492 [Candidatus Ishikawaella capsulata Mpkobe]|uniref:Uncharacterized protein n=1 Tax=Candidatus Ishikawaella capsulata Mpkobe TaxID=476281 RepID=C5WDD7_9ENTR|nr:hypothetical protein ICMP_492 [Candidatus Ishikawaella capsulata Mpkobe]